MTALPPKSELDGSSVGHNQGVFKAAVGGVRDFLSGLFGSTGAREDAIDTLRVLDPAAIFNLSLVPTVGANALTVNVKTRAGAAPSAADPVMISQRSVTAGAGDFNLRKITAALALTISSGSTLGHGNSDSRYIYWYLIDNAGAQELAASSKFFGLSGIVSTTAEGGAGAADSATVMYSATARSNVPFRCIGRMQAPQTTAGTWAALPTLVDLSLISDDKLSLSGGTLTGALNMAQGANIASASTINLDTATGNYVDVTGTTGITAITLSQGAQRLVRFTGALTLTHGASLVLPGGVNITTVAGDYALFVGLSGGIVHCPMYARASGTSLVGGYDGQCQLSKSGANLLLSPFKGNKLTINGATQSVPDAGVTLSASGLSVGTTYYIYAYMNAGTMTLEASATAPATQAGTGIKIKNGDATRTLVGMARVITGPAWADTADQRFVRSWFNDPGISAANELAVDATTTSATFVELNSAKKAEFLSWAGEPFMLGLNGYAKNNTNGTDTLSAIGVDSGTVAQSNTTASHSTATATIDGKSNHGLAAAKAAISEGYHYATLLGRVSGGTGTWFAGAGISVRTGGV